MLEIKFIEYIFFLCFYAYVALITSTGIEKVTFGNRHGFINQNFYATKTETLYQCMEICSQYPLCKSLFYGPRTCNLLKIAHRDSYTFRENTDLQYYEANMIPKSIAGVCSNNNCSIDTKCVPGISQSYVCIPHKFPTFTCPWNWAYSKRKCYYFRFKHAVSWQEAKMMYTEIYTEDKCMTLQANLTEIQSEEDETFLSTVLCKLRKLPRGLKYHSGAGLIWTSLMYNQNIGTWIWNLSGQSFFNYEVKLPSLENLENSGQECFREASLLTNIFKDEFAVLKNWFTRNWKVASQKPEDT